MSKLFNPIIWVHNDVCAAFELQQDISKEIKYQQNKINSVYKKDKNLKSKCAKMSALLNALADNI